MASRAAFREIQEFLEKAGQCVPYLNQAQMSYWKGDLGELRQRIEKALKPPSLDKRVMLKSYACTERLTVIGPSVLGTAFQCDPELFWERLPELPFSRSDFGKWVVKTRKLLGVTKTCIWPSAILWLKDFPNEVDTTLSAQLRWPYSSVVEDCGNELRRLFPDLYDSVDRYHGGLGEDRLDTIADTLANSRIPMNGPAWEVMYLNPPVARPDTYRSFKGCQEACRAEGLELASVEETLAMLSMLIGPMRFHDRNSIVESGTCKYRTSTACTDGYHLAVEAVREPQEPVKLQVRCIHDELNYPSMMAKGFVPA